MHNMNIHIYSVQSLSRVQLFATPRTAAHQASLFITKSLRLPKLMSIDGEENGNPLQYSSLRIPGTEEPGGRLTIGSHRVRHDWSDLIAAAAFPLSWWCHPTISSSVIPFSSCLQSFPVLGSFQWVSSSHQIAKVLEFQLQHQSFQWIFRTDFL